MYKRREISPLNIFLWALFIAALAMGCDEKGDPETYTVRFDTNSGSTIGAVRVRKGETIGAPVPPTRTGKFFGGWYTNDTFTEWYSFRAPVTADITLYARWSDYNIPDDSFRAHLKGQIPDAFNGEQLQTDHKDVKELTSLTVIFKNILILEGIQYFTGLTRLGCSGNNLSTLNVSANTALTSLGCAFNQLSALDVSTNTALTELDCSENQLTSLDISQNIALTELICYSNQLTSLDASQNTALTELICYSNQLTSLDVSSATALTELQCYSNQLSALDVSTNTSLTELDCHSNRLSSLNISGATALTRLDCYTNQLSALDVSTNTSLAILECRDNQLSSLDVANNTALTRLSCYSNQLSSLDVSTNTALTLLGCGRNQLTELNVSTSTALRLLGCEDNQLTRLDMRANKSLEGLSIHLVDAANRVFPNDKLAEILVHQDILCLGGDQFTSGIKGIFDANKGKGLNMSVKAYDDNGALVQDYDEAAYEAACP